MNKLVKGNLARGLPTKVFENDNTCVACKKSKQHRASCKTKPISSVDQPLYRLHVDLFGPTFVKSLNKKSYDLVVTDDYSRFTWVFFLATKDKTSPILKTFIIGLENQLSLKVKAEAVNTACYVKNRMLVTKPHNKTPYELLHGRTPSIGFMRPFSCPTTILNTLDSLGKFDGKVNEGVLVGYSVSSKAFRVFNGRTHIIQETLHVNFLENKPNVAGSGPTWLFKISSGSINPQNNDEDDAFDEKEYEFDAKKPKSALNVSPSSSAQSKKQDDKTKREAKGKSPVESFTGYRDLSAEFEDYSEDSINSVNAAGTLVPTVRQNSFNSTNNFCAAGPSNAAASPTHRKSSFINASQLLDDPELEYITYSDDENDVGVEADFNNLETSITVSLIPKTRVHKDHPMTQIIEPKRVHQALKDPSWIEAIQEELLQFKMQKVWVLVDFPYGKRAIVARIEAIRLFLAYASFMGFMVYQMDVKSAFLYGTIEEEVYVCQPLGFKDSDHPDKVYKMVKALYGLHQAPGACTNPWSTIFWKMVFKEQKKDGIFISQDKYVDEILRNFGLTDTKSASTPIDIEKPLLKDPDGKDVDVHTYRSMIGSLMYLTSSRPDIMFAACLCARFQVTPKASHLHVVKRIVRYLKGKPHLGLWYPKDSPFDLVAYSKSDYASASMDMKSTTKGCQFLRFRLISLQCKKQTVMATSSIEAEYVAAASCCAEVLWIQNQLLDYGYNFVHIIIYTDSSNTICCSKSYGVFKKDVACHNYLKCWLPYHTTNGSRFTMSNPHQELASPDQTVFGKTETGKEISNPFMAGSLPKIILLTFLHTTVAVKKVNDVIRLQTLVDKKKMVGTVATIREALRLDDAEGVDCLPNEDIFTELARMGYEKPSTKLTFYKEFFSSQLKFLIYTILQCMSVKRTSWNEFSSSMASAVICLSSCRKFNFSKKQVGDLSTHTTKYTSPALTQKVFANMRRVGKVFSGVETPLFEGMLVEQQVVKKRDAKVHGEDVNAGDAADGDVSTAQDKVLTVNEEPSISSPTPPTSPPQPSQDIPSTSQNLLQEVMDTCTALSRRVEHWELDKIAQALEITKLKRRVKKLEKRNKVKVLKLRRLQKVGTTQRVETSDETVMDDISNQGRMIAEMDQDVDVVLEDDKEIAEEVAEDNKDETKPVEVQEVVDVVTTAKLITEVVTAASETITAASTTITTAEAQVPAAILTATPDKGKGIMVVEPKTLKKQQQIKQDEKYARELEAKLNKNIDWDEDIDHVNKKAKEDNAVKRYQAMKRKPQTEAQATKNMMVYLKNVANFLQKTKEQIKEEEKSNALKRLNQTLAEKAAKRRKLHEEVEGLKRHLQIVPNKDDDVYTEATPLARKVPIVDYQIIKLDNKPYYKIIRADDTHQLYVSFLTLLRNFDREDLEALWSLVKERFSTTKPKNFFDDFLPMTLGAMFEKPDIHAQVWKNQRSLILLVERKYPLTRFTLDQMLNAVKLEVKEESEVSSELLKFT
nr:hypothetical protein [Tanacetum cinerariifolium]